MVNSECYKKIITISASILSLILLCVAMDDNITYTNIGFITLIATLTLSICVGVYILYKKYNQVDEYIDL